jgi:hypothetical protein
LDRSKPQGFLVKRLHSPGETCEERGWDHSIVLAVAAAAMETLQDHT